MSLDPSKAEPRRVPPAPPSSPVPPRPGRARTRAIIVAVIVVVIAAMAWVILKPHPDPQGRVRMGGGPMPIVAEAVSQGDIAIDLSALGTVTPLASVTVKTQIAGQLTQVGFQEGQLVHAGDFLAQIDPRPYQQQLAQYQGQLLRDQALLKDAEINLARYKTLVAQDSIAKQQLDTQASLVQQYQGTVATDQAQIDTAKLNLTYCHITAPVGGRVGLRQVDPGNYVQTSDTSGIVIITQLQPISVLFTLPEDNLPQVLKQVHGGKTLAVTAYDRAMTTKLAEGTLATIDNQIDTTTGTVKLRALFDNAEGMLFPNQFVNIRLRVETLNGVTVVPSTAVLKGAPGAFVYLVNPDNTVTVRPVKTGSASGDIIQITSGLDVGDKVVIDGTDKLRDGAQITLPGDKGGAGKSGGNGQPSRKKQ